MGKYPKYNTEQKKKNTTCRKKIIQNDAIYVIFQR